MWLEERRGDRVLLASDDGTKSLKATSKVDVERQDNCSRVPTLSLRDVVCGLRLCQAQLLPRLGAETCARCMLYSTDTVIF